ncbi:lipase member I isoform X5 [Meriones unguiculatus]|uniref:lipase member I isoform X5 n=1 Tax=Meriones unguiculatus TaxID=10047 RepID=UPI00293E711F|nr:lipase member I isoform X5 [Meriones unguiculatus]
MRIYIFLCLVCWVRFENNKTCLEFSKLNAMNSLKDLFFPKVKVNLMLYSRDNMNCAEPLLESNNLLNVRFNLSKKAVWIVHGYRPLGNTPGWLRTFIKTFLKHEDVNLIVVDWNQGATTFVYNRAVKNTRLVARSLSDSINILLSYGASLDNFHFIGMSLGAHISGFVGKIFQGQLGRITGLDPAGPNFSRKPANSRLDYTDAKFVDVIHSDSNGLGMLQPVGHVDFYPNGGKRQPGCPTTVFSDYQRGLCVDCGNPYKDSCPRLGNQAKQWREDLKNRTEEWPLRTTVYLDTSSENPFCSYYFVISIVALDETMRNGSISFSLLNNLGEFQYPKLYMKSKTFNNLHKSKILARVLSDVGNISRIYMTYFQSSSVPCPTCQYRIQSLMLKSLTYPERPPFCKYNFVLKERIRKELQPDACKAEMV